MENYSVSPHHPSLTRKTQGPSVLSCSTRSVSAGVGPTIDINPRSAAFAHAAPSSRSSPHGKTGKPSWPPTNTGKRKHRGILEQTGLTLNMCVMFRPSTSYRLPTGAPPWTRSQYLTRPSAPPVTRTSCEATKTAASAPSPQDSTAPKPYQKSSQYPRPAESIASQGPCHDFDGWPSLIVRSSLYPRELGLC